MWLIELGEAGEDRPVVAKAAVAVQFDELVEHQREIVRRVRPVLVAGDLHDLPRRQTGIDPSRRLRDLAPQQAQLFVLLGRTERELFQRAAAAFKFEDRLLEVEPGRGRSAALVAALLLSATTLPLDIHPFQDQGSLRCSTS